MSDYKKYYWNRNAATHRDALLKFAIVAGVASVIMGTAVIVSSSPLRAENQLALVAILTMVLVWAVVFGVMTWAYWALNEKTAEHHAPPAPPQKAPPITRVWSNGKLEYFTVGGDKEE